MEKVYRNNPVGVCSWQFSVSRVGRKRTASEKQTSFTPFFPPFFLFSRLFKPNHAKKVIPPREGFLSIKVSTWNNEETWLRV